MGLQKGQKSTLQGRNKKKTRQAAFEKQLKTEQEARAQAAASRGGYAAKKQAGPSAALRADRLLAQKAQGGSSSGDAGDDLSRVHRYKSFNDRLANIKLDRFTGASTRPTTGLDPVNAPPPQTDEDDLYATRFGAALAGWSELNLSAAFTDFSSRVSRLTGSLPLLLHHRSEIAEALLQLLAPPDTLNAVPGEKGSGHRHGFDTGLDLFPRLALDLGGGAEFAPLYPAAMEACLRLAGQVQKTWTEGDEAAAANLVERAFVCATMLLKIMGPWMLRSTEPAAGQCRSDTWRILRKYLGYVAPPSEENPDRQGHAQRPTEKDGEAEEEDEEDDENDADDDENDDHLEDGVENEEANPANGPDAPIPQAHSYLARKAKVSPHVRRFSSEALAHLIRMGDQLAMSDHAPGVVKTRNAVLAETMLSDLDQMFSARGIEGENTAAGRRVVRNILTFGRGVAGAWADACKSVDAGLNTNAAGIASIMLDSTSYSSVRSLVSRLMLTNLAHETKAKHFSELVQIVMDRFSRLLDAFNEREADPAELFVATQSLAVCVSVRKGKRVDDSIKSKLFAILNPLGTALQRTEGQLQAALMKLAVFLIPIGRLQDQMSAAVKFFDSMSGADEVLFPLLTALANPITEYDSFSQFALPVVIKRALQLSADGQDSEHDQRVLALLANLLTTGQLDSLIHPTSPSPTTARFVRSLARHVYSVLEQLLKGDDLSLPSVQLRMSSATQLATALVNSNTSLITVLDHLVGRAVATQSRPLITQLLPHLSASLSNLEADRFKGLHLSALSSTSFLPQCFKLAIQTDSQEAHLLIALRNLLATMREQGLSAQIPNELKNIINYPSVRTFVMASDVSVRCAAWDLLLFGQLGGLGRLVEELRDMERIPLQPDMVRHRQVKIRNVARMATQTSELGTSETSRIAVDALVSTLRVNLRPLWKEANAALSEVAEEHPDLVFNIAFEELTAEHVHSVSGQEPPRSLETPTTTNPTPSLDAVIPQELFPGETGSASPPKEWIDPLLATREAEIDNSLHAGVLAGSGVTDDLAHAPVRLDIPNYRLQILHLFTLIPHAIQSHNQQVVELYFEVKDDLVESVFAGEKPASKSISWSGLGQKQRTNTYTALLKVFSRLPRIRRVHRSQHLREAFLESCAAKDTDVQLGALAALLAYQEPELTPYTKPLENLLGKTSQRDELVKFNLAPDAGQIDMAHRTKLLPVVEHIFFGQMTATSGRQNKSGYKSRRIAMLNNLARCVPEELKPFFDLMTMPFKEDILKFDFSGPQGTFVPSSMPLKATSRQQRGFLSGLTDVLRYLRLSLEPYWLQLNGLLLTITVQASRSAAISKEEENTSAGWGALRKLGLRRLNDMFCLPIEKFSHDWAPFKPAIITELISPRLSTLPTEGAESVGALHTLFISWSKEPHLAYWLQEDHAILPQFFALLVNPFVKETVASAVLSVMENLTSLALPEADEDESDRDVVLTEMIGRVATHFTRDVAIWCSNHGKHAADGRHQILLRSTQQLIKLAINFEIDDADASLLFDSLIALVAAGSLGRNERLKAQVLSILSGLLPKLPKDRATMDQDATLDPNSFVYLLAKTFNESKLRDLRTAASKTLSAWAEVDDELAPVASLVADLNAYDRKRLDDIDIDRRLGAFEKLDDVDLSDLQTFEQLLLVANWSIFLQDDDMAVRSNASNLLSNFIAVAAKEPNSDVSLLLVSFVIPAVKKAVLSPNELVRSEGLRLLSTLAEKVDYVPELVGLRPLRANGDDDASFFENVYHIQTHRRSRALNRLADAAATGTFPSKTIKEYLLPLVRKVFTEAADAGESREVILSTSISAMSALIAGLDWRSYYHYLSTCLTRVKDRSKGERITVRLILAILQRFPFKLTPDETTEDLDDEDAEFDGQSGAKADAMDLDQSEPKPESESKPVAKSGGTARSTILSRVTGKLIPTLLRYLEPGKDSDDATRIPIAMGVVYIAEKLPANDRANMSVRLYRTLANILRARAQSTRDAGRDMILKVQAAFGSDALFPLVQTLQSLLTRDAQRATAAYVAHDLLFHTAERHPSLSLPSETVAVITAIAREDMFGRVAEDRVTAEGKLKQREMKRSKSTNTIELLAKYSSGLALRELLLPLREQMQLPMPNVKTTFHNLFRHLAAGLAENSNISKEEMATLCYSLITESSSISRVEPVLQARKRGRNDQGAGAAPGIITMRKRKDVEQDNSSSEDAWSMNAHYFVSLGLDLLLINLKKGRWDLDHAGDRARLNSLVDPVGNLIFAAESSIVESSLRAMASFARMALPALSPGAEGDSRIYVLIDQSLTIIRQNGGLHAELSQFALKLVSALLHGIPDMQHEQEHGLKDQLVQLLEWTKTDLEEPAVQSALFALLRVMLDKQVVVPIIYDVMDEVAKVLVTNQSSHVRNACRSLYLKFLLDYPHGKTRHNNQLSFLVSNLSYDFEAGRLSVLELLRAVVTKFNPNALSQSTNSLFIALVMRIANDESAKVRETATNLLQTLLGVVPQDRLDTLLLLVQNWAKQTDKPNVVKLGLLCYRVAAHNLTSQEQPEWLGQALRSAASTLVATAGEAQSGNPDAALAAAHALQLIGTTGPKQGIPLVALHQFAGSQLWDALMLCVASPVRSVNEVSIDFLSTLLSSTQDKVTDAQEMAETLTAAQSLLEATRMLTHSLILPSLTEDLGGKYRTALAGIAILLYKCGATADIQRDGALQEEAKEEEDTDAESEPEDGQHANMGQEDENEGEKRDSVSRKNADPEGGSDTEEDEDPAKYHRKSPLAWWFSRLSFALRNLLPQWNRYGSDKDNISRQAVVLFGALLDAATALPAEDMSRYLPHLIHPTSLYLDEAVFKASEWQSNMNIREAATMLQKTTQRKVGASAFTSVLVSLRAKVDSKRRERRNAIVMQRISDPASAAKRRARLQQSKHASRKRKAVDRQANLAYTESKHPRTRH